MAKRLIDAVALLKRAEWYESYDPEEGDEIAFEYIDPMEVENAPTVDAVEVVRCKDCKFYTESKNRCDHPCMDYDVECYDQWLEVNPDDFCSYGERRSDHETDKSG